MKYLRSAYHNVDALQKPGIIIPSIVFYYLGNHTFVLSLSIPSDKWTCNLSCPKRFERQLFPFLSVSWHCLTLSIRISRTSAFDRIVGTLNKFWSNERDRAMSQRIAARRSESNHRSKDVLHMGVVRLKSSNRGRLVGTRHGWSVLSHSFSCRSFSSLALKSLHLCEI